jgi:hypothetical protein
MQQAVEQLQRVRSRARLLLLLRCVFQWSSAMLAVALICGWTDYLLRLPVGVRVVIALLIALPAVIWLIRHLRAAANFDPDLSVLALRAETLFPQVAGKLASAVEFITHGQTRSEQPVTASLALSTVGLTERSMQGVLLGKLINPSPSIHAAIILVIALLPVILITQAWPDSARIAAKRWFLPWSGEQWPKRVSITSLMPEANSWPSDTPVRLTARIERGHSSGLRTSVRYRVVRSGSNPGPWRTLLMNEQSGTKDQGHDYERVLDLAELGLSPESAAASQKRDRSSSSQASSSAVEFAFFAGDDQTLPQQIKLVDRPFVVSATATIQPPDYAQFVVAQQQTRLDTQPGAIATASGLTGSKVTFKLALSKPVPSLFSQEQQASGGMTSQPDLSKLDALVPGLSQRSGVQFSSGLDETGSPVVSLNFTLDSSVQTPVKLTDEHGLQSLSQRIYRFTATEDRPPVVSVVEPASDESVLPSAVVSVQGVARDDVSLASLSLLAIPGTPSANAPATAPMTLATTAGQSTEKTAAASSTTAPSGTEKIEPATQLRAAASLDLGPLKLKPGDEVTLFAEARDTFELAGQSHEPVRSAPRRLRVIDTAAMLAQMQAELAGLRQQASRAATRQQEIARDQPPTAATRQRELGAQLQAQRSVVESVQSRAQRNKLDDSRLNQTLDRAAQLLDEARGDSQRAQQNLDSAAASNAKAEDPTRKAASNQQQNVARALTDLVSLLDQGRDAVALQLQLTQLHAQQNALVNDIRQAQPQTLGKTPEQLTPEQRANLEEMAQKQAALASQAKALSQQMQTTADNLAKQAQSPAEQAAASAMSQAAALAQEQNLSQNMQQASASAKQNQLSQASAQGQKSAETLRQMLQKLDQQKSQEQAILRRKLAQLAELISKLIAQQQGQITLLDEANANNVTLKNLEPGVTALRVATISTAEQARQQPQTTEAAESLNKAAASQGQSIVALRTDSRTDAKRTQQDSLTHLQDALKKVQQARKKEQNQQAKQRKQELQKLYNELAQKQDELRKATADASQGPASRKQRADLIELGQQESDLRVKIAAVKERVESTLIFLPVHEQLDQSLASVVADLRAGQGGPLVVSEQEQIASTLRAMADALKADAPPEPFASSKEPSGGDGGGGGGPAPKPVPPLAELKLLRQQQESVYLATRAIADAPPQTPGKDQALSRLASRQQRLAEMGKQMIEQMNKASQHMPAPTRETKP